jgi:hypothetical protein
MTDKPTAWHASGTARQRGQYLYTVKEGTGGRLSLACEPTGPALTIVGPEGEDLHLGFTLRPDTTMEEAQELAWLMNRRIAEIDLY